METRIKYVEKNNSWYYAVQTKKWIFWKTLKLCGTWLDVEKFFDFLAKVEGVNNDIVYWGNSHKTCDWTQTLSVDVLDKYNRLNSNDVDAKVNYMRRTGYTLNELIDLAPLASDSAMIVIRDGFEIIEEQGKFFVKKKKTKYPKTYAECCDKTNFKGGFKEILLSDDEYSLYISFIKLKRCRDAYRKIAGEQMGLDKPWKPDWSNDDETKFCIYTTQNIISLDIFGADNRILAFPTEEMRDAFYENFKNEIEQCKELL